MAERPDRPRIGRKGNKKVRTGCRTCKIRKVKCDETKPFCIRCTSSGRVCDGYAPVPPRAKRTVPIHDDSTTSPESPTSRERSLSDSSALIVRRRSHGLLTPSPSLILGDSNSALTLFHHRTAPRLAGFLDNYFWKELILQLADAEPAIRHALTAVNSIYDYCETRGAHAMEPESKRLLHPAYAHGLGEYNKSIGALIKRQNTNNGDESVHLVCCVLFICIEMLGNERQAAMDHFEQGLRLLSNYSAGTQDNPRSLLMRSDIVRETIAPIFRRLSLQSIMLGRETPLIPLFNQIYNPHDVRDAAPFRSLAEASLALVAIMDEGLRLVHAVLGLDKADSGAMYDKARWKVMQEVANVRHGELKEDLEGWLVNFSPFAAAAVATSPNTKDKLGCIMMRVHHLISSIWVAAFIDAEESAFDSQVTSFASVVHYASEVLLMEKMYLDSENDTVFTFDMGVIAPLYFTCVKCRQRKVRLSALHLLKNWPRRENVWDPDQMYNISRRVIELEDPNAFDLDAADGEWPPEWKRIHRVDFELGKDEEGHDMAVALLHRKPLGIEGDWEVIREIIPGAPIVAESMGGFHFTAK